MAGGETGSQADRERRVGSPSATRRSRIAERVRLELALRLSPEGTRRATMIERYTVGKLSWRLLVRLNRWLEFSGKITTGVWAVFIVTIFFGVDWRSVVEETFNSGQPVRGAIILAVVIPTLLFVALHSMIGYGRWRVQRELWRRDIEHIRTSAGA